MEKSNLKTELNASRHRLEALEIKREVLCREQISAASAQRELWLSDTADEKALTRAATRLSTAEATLAGIDDALSVTRDKITQLTADLTLQRDTEQREQLAQQIEARIPMLRDDIATIGPMLAKLAGKLHDCYGIPEAEGAARLLEDSWGQITKEITERVVADLDAKARGLRAGPAAPVVEFKPQPVLRPQIRDSGRPDAGFVDWDHAR